MADAVGEELFGEVADLRGELIGRQRDDVLGGLVEAEIPDHVFGAGVGGERPERPQRLDLADDVVRRPADEQAKKPQPLRLVQASRDPVVEQRHPPVGCTKRLPPCRSPWKTP